MSSGSNDLHLFEFYTCIRKTFYQNNIPLASLYNCLARCIPEPNKFKIFRVTIGSGPKLNAYLIQLQQNSTQQ